MGKVARNGTTSVRQDDAHYAQRVSIKTVIRPVRMFGSEPWAPRKAKQNLLGITERIMFTWMMGITRTEKIRNDEIRAKV